MNDLTITRTEILRQMARSLGFSRDGDWTDTERLDLEDALRNGERQFYNCPILPKERTGHRWSWLRTLLTLPTEANVEDYRLPSTFGGFVGVLNFAPADNIPSHIVQQTSMQEILAKRQLNTTTALTGPPSLYATYPLASEGKTPERMMIALWPTPDAVYTLTGEYFLNPYGISEDEPYPLGGQPHAQTLLMSCLATADQEMNQSLGGYMAKFMELLATSVSFDRGATGPYRFGYNRDNSAGDYNRSIRHDDSLSVLYNGRDYSSVH